MTPGPDLMNEKLIENVLSFENEKISASGGFKKNTKKMKKMKKGKKTQKKKDTKKSKNSKKRKGKSDDDDVQSTQSIIQTDKNIVRTTVKSKRTRSGKQDKSIVDMDTTDDIKTKSIIDTTQTITFKQDVFFKGHPYNVYTKSPDVGSILNFYDKYFNVEKNKINYAFFENVYQYELNELKKNVKSQSYNIELKAYLNMSFKIDTLHDFLSGRGDAILNKKTILSILNWNREDIANGLYAFSSNEDEIDEDDTNQDKKKTKINKTKKGKEIIQKEETFVNESNEDGSEYNSSINGFENDLLYWLITKNIHPSDSYKIYTSSCVENFSDKIAEQNNDINIVIDASEKRIDNFKQLLLFQKYMNVKQNPSVSNINENVIVQTLKETNNLNCKIIFPQIFDSNPTTGKSISWRNKILYTFEYDDSYNSIKFNMIDDECEMKYHFVNNNTSIYNKSVEFNINNKLYPINNLIIVNTEQYKKINTIKLKAGDKIDFIKIDSISKNDKTTFKFNNNDNDSYQYLVYDTSPGVSKLITIYKNIYNKIVYENVDNKYINEELSNLLFTFKNRHDNVQTFLN